MTQHRSTVLRDISHSVFWNTALLPFIAVANLAVSILIRRSFELQSGIYDVLMGLSGSILFYSSLGLPSTLPKFVPEVQALQGRQETARVLRQIATLRAVVLAVLLAGLNMWAGPIAARFSLGDNGAAYIRVLTLLIAAKAAMDLIYRGLESLLAQFAVNMLMMLYAIARIALVAASVLAGWGIGGLVGALGVSAAIVAVAGVFAFRQRLQKLPDAVTTPSEAQPAREPIWKFAALTYVNELCLYFSTPAFGSPALAAALGGHAPVALFATSYFVASSAVSVAVSSFRGIYRPLFARIRAAGDPHQMRRAFELACKGQVLAVVPAGFGLAVMIPDYLMLLYGPTFAGAVPVARILVALLFLETVLAIGLLVLWVDARYRPVLTAQAVLVLGAPVFIAVASRSGLVAAALVLGGCRVCASVLGYLAARRIYGVKFPWMFAGRVGLLSAGMAGILQLIRLGWGPTALEAASLTLLGVVLVVAGLKVFHLIGADELGILERAAVPGRKWVLQFLHRSR